jgi:hypothetical protein
MVLGTPLPSGGLEGLSVLDLGCGSGRDCYLASALVGPNGKVVRAICLFLTPDPLCRCEHTFGENFRLFNKLRAGESTFLLEDTCILDLSRRTTPEG